MSAKELALFISLAAVMTLFLSCGTPGRYREWSWGEGNVDVSRGLRQPEFNAKKLPHFGHYRTIRTLNEDEFPLDVPNRRVIFIGDIHGMYKPFSQILDKLEYNPANDLVIHTGDFLAKGLHHHSMATLDYMAKHNITGVRGNHDQQIIEWRGWINWICSSQEGCSWLKRIEHHRKANHKSYLLSHMELDKDLDDYLDVQLKKAPSKDRRWWKLIPAGWKFLSGQYRIAREMSEEQYQYLLELPLTLYIPHAHTFVAHAGMLPSDPRYPYYDAQRQPLARIPDIFKLGEEEPLCNGDELGCTTHLRKAQEMAILADVPQNKVPWNLMNMRGVKNGKVFRKYTGQFWATLWNQQVGRCVGYTDERLLPSRLGEGEREANKKKNVALPCYPATVVYGHSASRGLTPKRWSIGLDSGCVHGRKLTALVLGRSMSKEEGHRELYEPDTNVDEEVEGDDVFHDGKSYEATGRSNQDSEYVGRRSNANRRWRRKHKKGDGDIIPFGDHYKAKIVSVKCH